MPPKNRFTKEEILQAAIMLTRREGIAALTARGLAEELGTSPKPIFGLFANMDEVRTSVLTEAHRIYQGYLQTEMERADMPPYKASGMGYIRFAREERELFKLLFMRDRSREQITENREELRPLLAMICSKMGVDEDQAFRFHMEMWIFVHGIATMLATSYLEWDTSLISEALTDTFEGMRLRVMQGGRNVGSHSDSWTDEKV